MKMTYSKKQKITENNEKHSNRPVGRCSGPLVDIFGSMEPWTHALSKGLLGLSLNLNILGSKIEICAQNRIDPDDPEFEKAKELATPGRILLDIKRSGIYKARAVKQGFKEDKAKADGADFNYYAHVAKLVSVRTSLFRPNSRGRRVALKYVQIAFLQSHEYEDGMVKYVCFRHPVIGEWHYYRQTGPIYGEASAPVRWENTVAPWLEE